MSATDAQTRKYKRGRESWGSIRKLPSGRLQASYEVDGERYTAAHTFDNREDARAFLAGVRTDIARGKWRDPKTVQAETFGKYAETWIAQRVSSSGLPLRSRTRDEYRRQLGKGLVPFAKDRLERITTARVRTWHAERLRSGATQAARETALLRAVLNTAVTDGIIERNPVPSNLAKSKTGVKHRPPTLDELAVMIDVIDEHFRLALLLAAYGGLRLSEWRALCRKDVTIKGDHVTVHVERQAQRITGRGWEVGPPKSAEGVRAVALPAALVGAVRDHLAKYVDRFPDSLLFAPAGSSSFADDSVFAKSWNRARVAAGVRVQDRTTKKWASVVREHDLRHFALSFYAEGGATLAELKARAGHSTASAALTYQHALTDRGEELADRMPALPSRPKLPAQIGTK